MYYGPQMIKQSGIIDGSNTRDIIIASIPLGFINTLGNAVSIFYIEDWGRKFIMLRAIPFCVLGMSGMALGIYLTYFSSYVTVG